MTPKITSTAAFALSLLFYVCASPTAYPQAHLDDSKNFDSYATQSQDEFKDKQGRHEMTAEDERAINAVLVRYATGIDRRDWQLFATCFTEDMVADYGDIGKWRGRDVFVDFMEKGHKKIGPTMHRITNIVVTGDRDHAAATSYVDALLMPLQSGGTIRRASGRYEDQLVRVKGEWKISNRRFVSVLITNSPS